MSANLDKQIEKIKAHANAEIAQLKSTGVRTALIEAVKNPKVTEDELYTACKAFANLIEKKRRSEKNSK